MKNILLMIAAIPALALFGGIGILAWRIGETWQAETTQGLVTGLTVICGGGALLVCILLAIIVGVPFAIRAYGEGSASHRVWEAGRPSLPSWDAVPPPVRRPTPATLDGQWRELPPPSPTPPWGATGGGSTQLLAPSQDERFRVER